MSGLTNDSDFDHKSQPLSSSRGKESHSGLQETNLSSQESSQEVKRAAVASLRSALAQQHTIQRSQREANEDRPPANDGAPPSTPEIERPVVSRSSSLNCERRVGKLVVSQAQQSPRDLIARSPSLNSERELSSLTQSPSEGCLSQTASLREPSCVSRRSSLATLHETPNVAHTEASPQLPPPQAMVTAFPRRQLLRHSSLRHQIRPSDNGPEVPSLPSDTLGHSASDHLQVAGSVRPKSLPPSKSPAPGRHSNNSNEYDDLTTPKTLVSTQSNDPWRLPALSRSAPQTPKLKQTSSSRPPSLTIKRLSSLDQFMSYREDKELWKRESFVSVPQLPDPNNEDHKPMPTGPAPLDVRGPPQMTTEKSPAAVERELEAMPESPIQQNKFRHFAAEVGFCFTIAMTQLLAEYLISGFAIVLPNLFEVSSREGAGMTGLFWPAALLSLILSAFLLIFARVADMYGGYGAFMFGLIWLTIWTLIPGFVSSNLLLNVSRAMQGLAIAAFTPSTFSMVGSIYPEGPRRNVVLGLYGACAPLGFFAGFLAGGALPADKSRWYFWIASALAFITTVTAYLSVPHDKTDRKRLNLKMDWLGAFLITSGLILVTYALSVQPYANADDLTRNGFTFRVVYAPLSSGTACLAIAFWVEGWYASCPLLPFEFFKPQGVKAFSIACLFFYGSFGVWLYNSAEYFVSPSVTHNPDSIKGIMLSLWYTPMAVGGMIFCVIGSSLLHIVPIKLLLILSGLAWIGAPLVFAVGPIPLTYWSEVLPSMICGTLGIDLTFTIAAIFLSSSQPLKFQGVAGAVSSILVNLAMSFSLPISLIVKEAVARHVLNNTIDNEADSTVWGFRAAFIYGAASAGCGLVVCIFFVKISRSVVCGKKREDDEERPKISSSPASTCAAADDARRSHSV